MKKDPLSFKQFEFYKIRLLKYLPNSQRVNPRWLIRITTGFHRTEVELCGRQPATVIILDVNIMVIRRIHAGMIWVGLHYIGVEEVTVGKFLVASLAQTIFTKHIFWNNFKKLKFLWEKSSNINKIILVLFYFFKKKQLFFFRKHMTKVCCSLKTVSRKIRLHFLVLYRNSLWI